MNSKLSMMLAFVAGMFVQGIEDNLKTPLPDNDHHFKRHLEQQRKDEHIRITARTIGEMLRAGASYRAITGATGVPKAALKKMRRITTGRWFGMMHEVFIGRGKQQIKHVNFSVVPERYDPLTKEFIPTVDQDYPSLTTAQDAWAWLRQVQAEARAAYTANKK